MERKCAYKIEGAPCTRPVTHRAVFDTREGRMTAVMCEHHFRSLRTHTMVASMRVGGAR